MLSAVSKLEAIGLGGGKSFLMRKDPAVAEILEADARDKSIAPEPAAADLEQLRI